MMSRASSGAGRGARGEQYVGLGHREPDRVGEGTTAASATASCSISTLSSSNGEIR